MHFDVKRNGRWPGLVCPCQMLLAWLPSAVPRWNRSAILCGAGRDAVTNEQLSVVLEAAAPQEGASIMQTLAQQWLAEGRDKGRTEGRTEGRAEGIQEGQVQGSRSGLLTGIEVALDLKFGAAGLALLPEIRAIADVVLLRAVLSAIRDAASVDALRAVYRTAS